MVKDVLMIYLVHQQLLNKLVLRIDILIDNVFGLMNSVKLKIVKMQVLCIRIMNNVKILCLDVLMMVRIVFHNKIVHIIQKMLVKM